MGIRQHILDIIGVEYSSLKGKELVKKFQQIMTTKGEQEGRKLKNDFLWGVYYNGNVSKDLVVKEILPILHTFPEDREMTMEIGVLKAGDGIVRHIPLGSPKVKYPEDEDVVKMYFKLEGYYDVKNKEK